jgi:uncharacterized protein with HEPN domain
MKTRHDKLYVFDIKTCCENIENYIANVSEGEFLQNKMLQDALVRNIEIIGEASKNLSIELREQNSQVAWREIMRMRDKIVHHYFRLNLDVIWQTVSQDIPTLKVQIEKILESFPANSNDLA